MIDLKNHICKLPFTYMEVGQTDIFPCCPNWLQKSITKTEDVGNAWDSDSLKEIQQTILDGSYKYCSVENCPPLSKLVNTGKIDLNYFTTPSEFKKMDTTHPKTISFGYDKSCNLSCPSCRLNVEMADGIELERVNRITDIIIKRYGENLEGLYISPTADPFASKSFRKLIATINTTTFPKLKYIHLHTNAILFNQKTWKDLPALKKFLKAIEISVDAATKETYIDVRRGGNWDVLIENLKFISTLKINEIIISMVVSDSNFMEMESFYNMMNDIFKGRAKIFFKKINNWGTYSDSEFLQKNICLETHPMFNLFLLQLSKINHKDNCIHNMHDIITKWLPKQNKII